MPINLDPYPPHKKLYQDIFNWCQETGKLPLESEMEDLISIVLSARAQPLPADREKVAKFMLDHGFATGHGDTIDDLLSELSWQIKERKPVTADLAAALGALDKLYHVALTQTIDENTPDPIAARDTIKAALMQGGVAVPDGLYSIKSFQWEQRRSGVKFCTTPVGHFEIGDDGFVYSPYVCKYPDYETALSAITTHYEGLVLGCLTTAPTPPESGE